LSSEVCVGGITGVSWSWDDQIRVANRERLRIEFGVVEVEDEWDADSAMGTGIAAVLRWIGLRSSTGRNAECMPRYRDCGQESASEARGKRGHGLARLDHGNPSQKEENGI